MWWPRTKCKERVIWIQSIKSKQVCPSCPAFKMLRIFPFNAVTTQAERKIIQLGIFQREMLRCVTFPALPIESFSERPLEVLMGLDWSSFFPIWQTCGVCNEHEQQDNELQSHLLPRCSGKRHVDVLLNKSDATGGLRSVTHWLWPAFLWVCFFSLRLSHRQFEFTAKSFWIFFSSMGATLLFFVALSLSANPPTLASIIIPSLGSGSDSMLTLSADRHLCE